MPDKPKNTNILRPWEVGSYSVYRVDKNKKYIPLGEQYKDIEGTNDNIGFQDNLAKVRDMLKNLFRETSIDSDTKLQQQAQMVNGPEFKTPSVGPDVTNNPLPQQQIVNKKEDEILGEFDKKSYLSEIDRLKAEFDKIVYETR